MPHPGQHHRPDDEATGDLSQPAPQKDTAWLPLFAAEGRSIEPTADDDGTEPADQNQGRV